MKKLVSVVLALLMLAGIFVMPAGAQSGKNPTIITTGYAMTMLYDKADSEDRIREWYFSPTDILKAVIDDAANLPKAMLEALMGDPTYMGQRIADGGKRILPYMYCNSDGTSVSPVTHYPNDPAITNYKYLNESNHNKLGDVLYESKLCERLIDDVGEENVFIFQYDFRIGVLDCANELKQFISDVLEYTGAEKVNLFGMSYGGLITGTYLSMYGKEMLVDNVVLDVPALGGASFAEDFLLGQVELPAARLIEYAERGLTLESGLSYALEDAEVEKINTMMSAFLKEIGDMPLNWQSMWDLLPAEDYPALRDQLLDKNENSVIIQKSDYLHNVIMPNYRKVFTNLKDKGMRISILCSTGNTTCFGGNENADMMLEASRVSGATTTLLGSRFADGYSGCGTNCGNKSHIHVSPAMQVDATTAYLPENTWFIEDQFHGMYFYEEHSLDLIEMLLLADTWINVHTYPEFPQFDYSTNSYHGIYAKFDSSKPGYLTGKDTALTVTNISARYPIKLTAITVTGTELAFDDSALNSVILPGKSVSIPITGSVAEVASSAFSLKIDFLRVGALNPVNTRTFDCTLFNGAIPDYDEDNGIVSTYDDVQPSLFETIKEFFSSIIDKIVSLFMPEEEIVTAAA